MIDCENEICNSVTTALQTSFAGIYVTSEYVPSPSSFPCVSLVEMDNAVLRRTQSSSSLENHAEVMYEVNVYSNKAKSKKAECKAIAALIDEKMMALGFTRMMLSPVPNVDKTSIYRILGRYRAVIGKDKTIYRR